MILHQISAPQKPKADQGPGFGAKFLIFAPIA
jgi:hypothetical protein